MKTATAAAGALAFTNIMPGKVLGANERITYGIIGCGGMGNGHIDKLIANEAEFNTKILSVCDVYQRRLTAAQTRPALMRLWITAVSSTTRTSM